MKRALPLLIIVGCAQPASKNATSMPVSAPASTPSSAPASAPQSTIKTREITYKVGDFEMKGYMAWDASRTDRRPGVLVVHEWWGHNAYARRRAEDLAKLGYVGFAVDMYGNGKTASHPKDAGEFAGAVMSNPDAAQARFEAAIAALNGFELTEGSKTAAIGYCFGGGVVLHMARRGLPLAAVASFHGSLGTKEPVTEKGKITAKILVAHGADDPFVKKETIEAFKQEMADAGADLRFRAYEGAVHSFTNPDADMFGQKFSLPLKYNAAADEQSWAEMKALFAEAFGS